MKPGFRVAVPFGKRKVYTALVVNIHRNPPETYEAKSIQQILDEKAVVRAEQLSLWKWVSSYYMCSMGDIFRAALPKAFLLESETIIYLNADNQIDESILSDHEFLVIEALGHQSSLKIEDLWAILDTKKILPIINSLIEKEYIAVQEELYEQYKPKEESYVVLHEQYTAEEKMHELLDVLSRAPKQREVVMRLFTLSAATKKPIKKSILQKESNSTAAIIKTLVDKGILKTFKQQVDRVTFEGETNDIKALNVYQQRALDEIEHSFLDKEVTLLHGVTSSGKTEIYVQLIEKELTKGRQVLYLVPEIALTTQLIQRLQYYFGEKVSIFHSKYSVNERVEVWNNMLNKSSKAQLIVGARSAIFLPFSNLGLTIIDEEHEASYKQFDPAPRYHARDTAVVLANIFKAKVLMGTATPAVETYFNAKQDKYGLVNLDRRYGDVLMPDIELVDLKDKHKKKRMQGHFSDRLIEEIEEALKNNEQVILFKNRRGFSPIVECGTCGHSPECPNCDVSLTYHQYKNELRCHYCGYRMAMQINCQACGVANLDSKGFGTQQVEAELKELFPKVKVGRMDLDTTRGKHGYEKIINAFENEEISILVGTQMLTKGLDFRNVGLVGIMSADSMLNFPDFRAHERSFHLMLQVAGRAGRTKKRGKVLIQSFNPYHQILQQVSTNDYLGMFTDQINERRQYEYPPFFRLIKVTLKHKDFNKVNRGADWLSIYLKNSFGKYVLGPEFPPIARIRNQYHKNILIKIPKQQSLTNTKTHIKKIRNSFEAIPDFRSIRLTIDVDNY